MNTKENMTNNKSEELMYELFKSHEDVMGSSRMSMLALTSLIESIKALNCSASDFWNQYRALIDIIKNLKHKLVPFIHLIKEFEEEIEPHMNKNIEELKRETIKLLSIKNEKLKDNINRVIANGKGLISDGDVLIVHTASLDIMNMLVQVKEHFNAINKKFKVLVLNQDFTKTKQLINTLSKTNIEVLIVPEYCLGDYINIATKLFMGVLSITYDLKAVCAVGSNNIVSLCHLNDIPVYLFANTLKFSSSPEIDHQVEVKHETIVHKDCEFILTMHSPDIVNIGLIDYLITEEKVVEKDFIKEYAEQVLTYYK